MKYIYSFFIMIMEMLFCDWMLASSVPDYGLYFHSHAAPAFERTSLFLDQGLPFSVKNDFLLSFRMLVRSNEPDYGSILHLKTDNGQTIHFSLVGSEEKHMPALVLNEGIAYIDVPIEKEHWVDVTVHLRCKENVVDVVYDNKHTSAMLPLQGMRSVTAVFGIIKEYQADVAPINVKDICVWQDGIQTREWKLWKHKGEFCYDNIQKKVAQAASPFWLIDNHIEWKEVYRKTISEKINVVFDAKEALFYLVGDHTVKILDESGTFLQEIPVLGGYPATSYANHMLFDTLTHSIVSYSQRQGDVSVFSLSKGRWSNLKPSVDEPRFYNHAKVFNSADSTFYFFGGYGFYQYRNELFKMRSSSDSIVQVVYERPFYPRFSSAMGVAGNELFIFGGRGNKYGKQELTSEYYNGLCVLDLKTMQSKLIWKRLQNQINTIMASSMYFEPADSSFYAFSMDKGGVLWKVFINDSIVQEVSKPIDNVSAYQDLDLSFYLSSSRGKMFVVMDKILSNRSHDISIYSINMPLLAELDTIQEAPFVQSEHAYRWVYWMGLAILSSILVALVIIRHFKKQKSKNTDLCTEDEKSLVDLKPVKDDSIDKSISDSVQPVTESRAVCARYNRTKSAINLLGCFSVYDKEGNDITVSFTPKLKHLLILLIIYSEKYSQGILSTKITDILWPDKEESSARNNRNVSLRKLRVLLENIGNSHIVTENNFLRIQWEDDVFCDYHTAFKCIRAYNEHETDELLECILELLLYGPLLPNTTQDWLDDFKDAFSSTSIDLLRSLLEMKREDEEMVLRLTDIIFLHDPLNEEALSAKCAVLSSQGKKGIARNIYDRFCREYHESLDEEYKVPFSDL